MQYLLSLMLVLALFSIAHAFSVVIDPPAGFDQRLGALYVIVLETGFAWLALAAALIYCGAAGAFPWPQAGGLGGVAVVFLGFGVILFVAWLPVLMSLELGSSARAQWTVREIWSARIAAFGLPLVLALYAGWMINAPPGIRASLAPHLGALGALGVLCVLASVVSVWELVRSEARPREYALEQQAEAERAQAKWREFAVLTDADPLAAWYPWTLWDPSIPTDLLDEARRRVAARPQLEAELAADLASNDPSRSTEALSFIANLPFRPGAALEAPLRSALAAYAERLERSAQDPSDVEARSIDDLERATLFDVLHVGEKMAEAGVDLREPISRVERAVAKFPNSRTARDYSVLAPATTRSIGDVLKWHERERKP